MSTTAGNEPTFQRRVCGVGTHRVGLCCALIELRPAFPPDLGVCGEKLFSLLLHSNLPTLNLIGKSSPAIDTFRYSTLARLQRVARPPLAAHTTRRKGKEYRTGER